MAGSEEFGACDFEFGIYDRHRYGLSKNKREWLEARKLLDKAIHSDQYFWADADVWHFGMVEKGARMLCDAILALPDKDKSTHKQSMLLYDKIVSLGESLYGRDKRG